MSKKEQFTLIIIGTFMIFSMNLYGTDYMYTWVNYKGRKVKKWLITNESFYKESKVNRVLALIKKQKNGASFNKINIGKGDSLRHDQGSALLFSFNYGMTSLKTVDKSNGSKASIYSNGSYSSDLEWQFRINKWTFFSGSSFEKTSFKPGRQIVSNVDVKLLGLRLGVLYGDR